MVYMGIEFLQELAIKYIKTEDLAPQSQHTNYFIF